MAPAVDRRRAAEGLGLVGILVALLIGAYTTGRAHQAWTEGAAREQQTAAQIEADRKALKTWGAVARDFTGWLVEFLSPERRPDIVRIVHETPNRGDCPHTDVSARLRNENARALNAARARDRAALASDGRLP